MESAESRADANSSLPERACVSIQVDVSRCCDCRICEVVCSFHLTGAFDPASSAMSITYEAATGIVEAQISDACDLCEGEAGGPLCIANCPIEGTLCRTWCG